MPSRLSSMLLVLAAVLATPAAAHAANCAGTQTGLVPLTGLGAGFYQGFAGGLYPGGANTRPPAHDAAGVAIAHAIAPLDTFGAPTPGGRVVLISIGMSNATQEFSAFVQVANGDPSRKSNVQVVDCAQGGQTAALIKNPAYAYWDTVKARLRARGSSPLQAQIAWIKEANAGPTSGFPAATTTLMNDLGSVVRTLHDHFPNIRIAYLSSRIYAGYATTALNPEPYAYESGFAVKWLIEGQINGVDSLEYDAAQGTVEAPWLAWGPYLWADGLTPRPGDGLTWACADFSADGTHPAAGGRLKVANLLRDFMHTDATATPWYLATPVAVAPTEPPGMALAAAPVPARGPMEIAFVPPAGREWRLEALDLAGRRVRDLASGLGDGQRHSLRWDGRDDRGAPAPAGAYWLRLASSGGPQITRRVVVLGGR
jgi:hypothetical protein